MAYSYQDFENAAKQAGLLGNFSQYDLDLARRNPEAGMSILSYKQDYNSATTDQQRAMANAAANQIRSSFGSYTGGFDGSRYYALGGSSAGEYSPTKYGSQIDDVLGKIGSFGSFDYGPAPKYDNAYAQQQKALLDAILNREDFSWSKDEDPLWGSYKKSYLREGDRATANALGQASAASGGRPSSYAANAAAQAGDYYATKLNDVIPTLYQQAYDRYLQEYQMKLSDLGAVNNQEQLDYSRYLTDLGQYNTDRSQAYNQYLDGYNMLQNYLNNLQGRDDTMYSRYLDSVSQQMAERENQLEMAKLGVAYGDYAGLSALGITPADVGGATAGSRGGGGNGNYTGNYDPQPVMDPTLEAQLKGLYPDGNVTSEANWNYLLEHYDEKQLNEWGWRFSGKTGGTDTNPAAVGTGLDYQPDEGIFTWNGTQYNSLNGLTNAIRAAGLTDGQKAELERKLKVYAGEALSARRKSKSG